MMTRVLSNCCALYSLLLFILFLHTTESNVCNFNIILRHRLHNVGFHRNITYEILFGLNDGEEMLYEGCSLGLEQILPAGLYASPDEIEDARYKTLTVFKSKVNIESPAHEAEPITVHLLSSVRHDTAFLYLPVHARYHRAVDGGGTARVDIPKPQMYLNCGAKKLDQFEQVSSDINAFCPDSAQQCLWKKVPAKVSKPLVWYVPVGDTARYNLVMFSTAAVVALGSIYLLKEIHCYKLQQQKKRS